MLVPLCKRLLGRHFRAWYRNNLNDRTTPYDVVKEYVHDFDLSDETRMELLQWAMDDFPCMCGGQRSCNRRLVA